MRRMPVEIAKSDYFKVVLALAFALALAASLLWALVGPQARDAQAQSSNQGETECVGFLTGPHNNVVVPKGATCTLFGATVTGNVKALPGSGLTAIRNTIGGNLEGDKHDDVRALVNQVGGNITLKEGTGTTPGFDHEVCGNTLPKGDIILEKNHGFIEVGSRFGGCAPNTVSEGNIFVQESVTNPPDFFDIRGNTVDQNLQVFKNTGTGDKRVQLNRVGENLQCKENQGPGIGTPNVAQKAEGQCAAPVVSTSSAAAEDAAAEDAAAEEQEEIPDWLKEAIEEREQMLEEAESTSS